MLFLLFLLFFIFALLFIIFVHKAHSILDFGPFVEVLVIDYYILAFVCVSLLLICVSSINQKVVFAAYHILSVEAQAFLELFA
jgi:hypothetical protein